jgi:hypothetical protein
VPQETLESHVTPEQLGRISQPANFCPSPRCDVGYFDGFERVVLATELKEAVYPKDPSAPLCACFAFTRDEVEQDIEEGAATRTRALLEKAKSRGSNCVRRAANGRSCVAYVQKYYMQCLQAKKQSE